MLLSQKYFGLFFFVVSISPEGQLTGDSEIQMLRITNTPYIYSNLHDIFSGICIHCVRTKISTTIINYLSGLVK